MGSDRIVSMVPFSYSRATTSEVIMAPTIMMMMATMPGMMKFRLSRSSLNQTRMRPSTGALIFSRTWRLRKSTSIFWLYRSMKAVIYPRVMLEKFGSLPSRST